MRLRPAPTFTVTVLVATFSLVAAGCGGGGSPRVASISSTSPSSSASGAATSGASALLLAGRCLRDHGLSDLPDPAIAPSGPATGEPIIDKAALRAFPDSVVSHAMAACASALAAAGIGRGSNVRTPQEIQDGLAFARCVRRHGIANFPDPNGQGSFDLTGTGINPHALSPAQLAAARACLSAAHGTINIPQQDAGGTGGQ